MSVPLQRPYLDQLRAHLPPIHLAEVERFAQGDHEGRTLELVLAFALGASCPQDVPGAPDRDEWRRTQTDFRKAINSEALPVPTTSTKRPHDDTSNDVNGGSIAVKKAKTDGPPENPVFTLHSISASAPIRKKVDVIITDSHIHLSPPSKSTPSDTTPFVTIPLTSIARAFLIPTRGKSKPHWTVVLLTSDSPPETPKGKAKATSTTPPDPNREIVFGLDADAPSPITYTPFISGKATAKTVAKGSSTLPALEELLGHLTIPVVRPSAAIFRGPAFSTSTKSRPSGPSASLSNATDGDQDDTLAGVDAHRGAKSGSLWFLETGLLWTDARPAEFWSLQDIVPAPDGVRMLSATGRTCSVFLTRRAPKSSTPTPKHGAQVGEDEEMEDVEEEGIETEFALIDGKEQDAIGSWVKRFGARFGKTEEELATSGPSAKDKGKGKAVAPEVPAGKVTIMSAMWEDDDDDDENFADSDDSSDEGGGVAGSDDNAGSDSDEDGSGEEDGGEAVDSDAEDAEGDSDEELDPTQHPLLRPGAMPKRVSKTVIDMVAGMVTDELLGAKDDDELEEDELDE
jgi:hypothetical protein